jgi:hypothetical protein
MAALPGEHWVASRGASRDRPPARRGCCVLQEALRRNTSEGVQGENWKLSTGQLPAGPSEQE